MSDWSDQLDAMLGEVRRGLSGVPHAVRSALDNDPFEVLAYRGYGNPDRLQIHGRALQVRNVSVSTDTDSSFRNLLNTYRRAEADPLAFATVNVKYANTNTLMKADDEGFFSGTIDVAKPIADDTEWNEYEVSLVTPVRDGASAVKGKGEILIPPPAARFGVISDLDDTVIQSRVSNFLQAARTVMLGNARTRLPFPGVAAFYRALRNGAGGDERNPIYYVSSSPWNIYDVITEFMDLQNIPRGPLLLRDWDIGLGMLSSARHFEHKDQAIRNILNLHPAMKFILIGDTSQQDPEIYRGIVAEFPNRIKAIYIRDVTRNPDRSTAVNKLATEILAAGSTLVLAEDTLGAAKHAAEQGWISSDALPDIGEEKKADEGRDDSKVAAPDGGKPTSGEPPTVIG